MSKIFDSIFSCCFSILISFYRLFLGIINIIVKNKEKQGGKIQLQKYQNGDNLLHETFIFEDKFRKLISAKVILV